VLRWVTFRPTRRSSLDSMHELHSLPVDRRRPAGRPLDAPGVYHRDHFHPRVHAMPSLSRLLLIAPVSLALVGCGILYKQPIYQGNLMEKEAVDQLRPGLSKQQVAGLLGTPSLADP